MLVNADCLKYHDKIEEVDFIISDLPYGKTGLKWDSVLNLELLWDQYKRILKPGGVVALTANAGFAETLVGSNPEWFLYKWYWHKGQAANWQLAKKQPLNPIEEVLIFSEGRAANGANLVAAYNPIMEERDEPVKSGGSPQTSKYLNKNSMKALGKTYETKYPETLIYFDKPKGKERIHPTQKPVELIKYMVETYTTEGQTVLDSTSGIGTTAIACELSNRDYICIEQNKEYHSIAINWLSMIQSGMDYKEALKKLYEKR